MYQAEERNSKILTNGKFKKKKNSVFKNINIYKKIKLLMHIRSKRIEKQEQGENYKKNK